MKKKYSNNIKLILCSFNYNKKVFTCRKKKKSGQGNKSNNQIIRSILINSITVFAFISILIIQSATLFCQEKLSLSDCYKKTLKKDKILKIYELSNEIAKQNIEKAEAGKLPKVYLSSHYSNNFKTPSVSLSENRSMQFGAKNSLGINLHSEMDVFSFGRLSNAIDIAKSEQNSKLLRMQEDVFLLTENILRIFYIVLYLQEIRELYHQNINQTEKLMDISTNFFINDSLYYSDFLSAGIMMNQLKIELSNIEKNYKIEKLNLSSIIGMPDSAFSIYGDFGFEFATNLNSQGLIKIALDTRLEIKLLENEIEIRKKYIDLANAGNKPKISLFSNYGFANGFDPLRPNRLVDNWNIGLNLAVPIFEPFPSNEKALQNRYKLMIVQAKEEHIKNKIKTEVQKNLLDIANIEKNLEKLSNNMISSGKLYKVFLTKYSNQEITFEQVKNAFLLNHECEMEYARAIYLHIGSRITLCKTIDDFSWFIPTANLKDLSKDIGNY